MGWQAGGLAGWPASRLSRLGLALASWSTHGLERLRAKAHGRSAVACSQAETRAQTVGRTGGRAGTGEPVLGHAGAHAGVH